MGKMDLGLKGRVAVVTGASQGIGKAIALSLSQEGSAVTICARNESSLVKTAGEIQAQTSNEVLPIVADVAKHGEIEAVVDATYHHFNRIDVLVNNTGGPPSTTFEETSYQNWGETFDSLFMSVVRACRAVIPHMRKAMWGRIINMTSFVAKQPADRLILSNAIRAGVLGLSKSLSNELAPYGILVNAVCPGWTLTARVEELARSRARAEAKTSDEIMKSWENQIPLRRLAQSQEIADLVVFLASERASYITGSVVQVDGGVIKSLV
jgi:3-oxoacyl-[acyl-carrier protein] reductase